MAVFRSGRTGAFDGADDFAANSVFGMPALASIPIRVDCGDSDPFYDATKTFIAQLPNPPAGGFSPGRAQPGVLEFATAGGAELDGTAPDGLSIACGAAALRSRS